MKDHILKLKGALLNSAFTNKQKKIMKFTKVKVSEMIGRANASHQSLNNIDAKLKNYLDFQEGFFIEAGANDGITQSNTYYLGRRQGWHGVLIEPVPMLYELCKKFRPDAQVFNCALGSTDGSEAELIYSDLMTITVGSRPNRNEELAHIQQNALRTLREGAYQIRVPMRTLSSVLDEISITTVDFFSLDVEGFETSVLRGIDFDRFYFRYILVETSNLDDVQDVLRDQFVMIEQFTHHDYLFSNKKQKPLI